MVEGCLNERTAGRTGTDGSHVSINGCIGVGMSSALEKRQAERQQGFNSSCTRVKQHETRHQNYIAAWLAGEATGNRSLKSFALSAHIRRYMLEKAKYECERCGFHTPHPVDLKTILEIDHIDGDVSNNVLDNLRVLCPNCHALTTTYRGRNKGSGRRR